MKCSMFFLLVGCFFESKAQFSMSFRDVGMTEDIQRIACSLNDIFKESFEMMTGSLGKHGVYYLPEIKQEYDYQQQSTNVKHRVEFVAMNGWMKYPTLKAAKEMTSGALRKYKVPLSSNMREVFLVCVGCLEVSAQSVNYCYEATYHGKNATGTITSGPVLFRLSLEMRITQTLKNERSNDVMPSCNILIGERSLELSDESNFKSEVRGLRSLNFLADNIDDWIRDHFNTTVKTQLEKRMLVSLNKVFTRHDMCDEFLSQ